MTKQGYIKRLVCKKCKYKATSSIDLGTHYKKYPSHVSKQTHFHRAYQERQKQIKLKRAGLPTLTKLPTRAAPKRSYVIQPKEGVWRFCPNCAYPLGKG